MENSGSKKSLSPVVAAIILIVVTVIVSIVLTAYMGALTFTFVKPVDGLDVTVNARIYSAKHNIGVLNEEGIFDISVKNYANSSRTINIVVDVDEHVLSNETVVIEALSSKNLTINQKLIFLGLWTIKIYGDKEISDTKHFSNDKEIVDSYSFITVVNEVEADMKITQVGDIRLNKTLSIVAIIISSLSVFVSLVHVMYARKQYIRDSKTRDKKEEDSKTRDKNVRGKSSLTE